nr:serine hydrolase [Neobacillus sp. Marseille-Q6967]
MFEDGESLSILHHDIFQSASLIKVPLLLVLLLKNKKREVNLEEKMTISEENKVGGSGVIQVLSNDLSLSIKDLMTLMITVSDNTATNMLINLFGIDEINESFRQIGLTQTVLNRKMIDFAAIEQGKDNFTTPDEIVHCLQLLDGKADLIGHEGRLIAEQILSNQQFRDKLPALIETERYTVLNKTGELPTAEHDCAIIRGQGRKVYVAVLMDRFVDSYEAKQTINRVGKHISDYLRTDLA